MADNPHRATELSHYLPIYKAAALYFFTEGAAVLAQRLLRQSTYNHSIINKLAEDHASIMRGVDAPHVLRYRPQSPRVPWVVNPDFRGH
jgi:hypothetical protein